MRCPYERRTERAEQRHRSRKYERRVKRSRRVRYRPGKTRARRLPDAKKERDESESRWRQTRSENIPACRRHDRGNTPRRQAEQYRRQRESGSRRPPSEHDE